jgi:hypothetical protein
MISALRELNDAVRSAGHMVFELHADSPATAFDDAADALAKALAVARDLARPNATGCSDHPGGPVDPTPGDHKGRCLLCNVYAAHGRTNRPYLDIRYNTGSGRRGTLADTPPDYDRARAYLATLPDFGAALVDQARAALGDDTLNQQLVIAAYGAARPCAAAPGDEPIVDEAS